MLALEHMHAHGVVHGNLKPSNVLLSLEGTPSPLPQQKSIQKCTVLSYLSYRYKFITQYRTV